MKVLEMINLKFLAIFCILQNLILADRVRDKIYDSIDSTSACFRRHNGTHQFGCSSSKSGSVGVVQVIENDTDVTWLEKNATSGPYIVVLSFPMLTMDNMMRFKKSGKVNGVLLTKYELASRPSSYSPDDTCPNRYSGYKECDRSWNPYGISLLQEDWPFPMFYLQDLETVQKIKTCYEKFNSQNRETQHLRSLCALEMKAFMFSAKDSETCLRRNTGMAVINPSLFCDPLGDRNIHLPLAPMNEKIKSVIIVAARLDAKSLFDGISPGAGSTVTGVAALLATAAYLHQLAPNVTDKNIVFMLFNGEMFDYIGSSRVVYDLKSGQFDSVGGKVINLNQVSAVIELGQLGGGNVYLHSNNFKKDDKIISNLSSELNATVLSDSLPPASIQSFLKENSSLPSVLIANHPEAFTNKFYNGILDDAEGLGYSVNDSNKLVSSLHKIVVPLAHELYRIVTNNVTSGNGWNVEGLISQILPCYLESADCQLFRAASAPGVKFPKRTLPMYVSITKSASDSTSLTGQLLAFLTGKKFPEYDQTTCNEKHLIWMAGYKLTGECISTALNFSEAVSPAFVIENYDMKSNQYSAWTESVWQDFSVRMFLKPPSALEKLVLIVGSSVAIVSFFLVWFVNSKANTIFDSRNVDL